MTITIEIVEQPSTTDPRGALWHAVYRDPATGRQLGQERQCILDRIDWDDLPGGYRVIGPVEAIDEPIIGYWGGPTGRRIVRRATVEEIADRTSEYVPMVIPKPVHGWEAAKRAEEKYGQLWWRMEASPLPPDGNLVPGVHRGWKSAYHAQKSHGFVTNEGPAYNVHWVGRGPGGLEIRL